MNPQTEKFIFIRHLEDVNNLREFIFDAPLKSNQKEILAHNTSKIRKNIEEKQKDVFIIHSSQKRSIETAHLLREEFINTNFTFMEEKDIDDFFQGKVILPDDHTPGDRFSVLQEAWSKFELEAFDNKNLEYKFGQDNQAHFEVLGESAKNFLMRNYHFLNELFSNKYNLNNTQTVICCHSTTILILMELLGVVSDERNLERISTDPKELSFISWEIYKDKIRREFPSGIEYGAVFEFEITDDQKTKMRSVLTKMTT